MYGWTRKVLRIDLTTGTAREQELSQETVAEYLGGRGLGARIIYDEVPPEVGPLSPENRIVFATGPLTGTSAPTAGRLSLSTKSPLTGTILDCNAGGRGWTVRLKKCGYDAVIIQGKANSPVYVAIADDKVSIEDAKGLWGMDTYEATDWLTGNYGQEAGVLCIGPAGENLVRIASITVDRKRSAGRGGAGAVLGSKNLKAIVVKGTRSIEVADSNTFDFITYEAEKQIKANPVTSKAWPQFGTAVIINLMNELGILPTRNFQESQFEGAQAISGEALADRLLLRKSACYGCPIACARTIKVAGGQAEGPEYETLWALGANCGVSDLDAIANMNLLCNRLGLDTISTGGTIACAMEMATRGILDSSLRFGDARAQFDLISNIAYREGLGDELAEGSKRFAQKYDSPHYAIQVKGMELPAYEPRGMQGQGLAFATSNRGACHLRANMLGPEIMGVPKMMDRFAFSGKAGMVIVIQHMNAVIDSLGVCKMAGFAVADDFWARMLTAVTGKEYTAQTLHTIGERIWTLERVYNLREGFTRADDTLPARLLTEPIPSGPSKGQVVHLEPMLKEYYRFRGWDENGVPTAKKLAQLGLGEPAGGVSNA